jgi:hypothetical protein
MLYTATLSAQNTSVFICDIQIKRDGASEWFANAMASGTFGGGTVSFQISPDGGATKFTPHSDGTNVAATLTSAGLLNLRCGQTNTNTCLKLYATIGSATTPSVSITVADNR